MLTNGRSNTHQITTRGERRAALWDHVFGTAILPVLHDAPRWQAMQGRGHDVLAYDLDTSRLSTHQRARFASHLARVEQRPYLETLAEVNSGRTYPVKATFDIQVLEPAEQAPSLASLLSGGIYETAQRINRRLKPRFRLSW